MQVDNIFGSTRVRTSWYVWTLDSEIKNITDIPFEMLEDITSKNFYPKDLNIIFPDLCVSTCIDINKILDSITL